MKRFLVCFFLLTAPWLAQALRVAVVAEAPKCRNLADLIVAQCSDRFEFVERSAADKILLERQLDPMLAARACENTDVFVLISGQPDNEGVIVPAAATLFDSRTGIRYGRIRLAGDEAEHPERLMEQLRELIRQHENLSLYDFVSVAAFRNAALLKPQEIEALELNFSIMLGSLERTVVVEREHLQLLAQEKMLSELGQKITESTLLLQVESLPDPTPEEYKTVLYVITPQQETIFQQEFRGAERDQPALWLEALAGFLGRPRPEGARAAALDEAKIFFQEFIYLHRHGKRTESLGKIHAALALDPDNIKYRAWAMEALSFLEGARIPMAQLEITALLGDSTDDYLKQKAAQTQKMLRERQECEKLGATVESEHQPLAATAVPDAPQLPLITVWKWPQARQLLASRQHDGKIYLLFYSTTHGNFMLYRVPESRPLLKFQMENMPDLGSIRLALDGTNALIASDQEQYSIDLTTRRAVRLPIQLPVPGLMAATILGERLYFFCGNGWEESLLYSCRQDGSDGRIEINPHRLNSDQPLEQKTQIMNILKLTAAPAEKSLYFVVDTSSNGGNGYAGFWKFNVETREAQMVMRLHDPGSTRSALSPRPIDNYGAETDNAFYWANIGSVYQNKQETECAVMMVLRRDSGAVELAAKWDAVGQELLPEAKRRLRAPQLFGAFITDGEKLYMSDRAGGFAIYGEDTQLFQAPFFSALYLDPVRGVLTGIAAHSVMEFKLP